MLLILLLASSVIASVGVPPVAVDRQSARPEIAFDEFMRLSPQARTERFGSLSAAGKAHIKRTQGERWLAANRARLSAKQLAATEAAIAFVSPDIYSRASDAAVIKRGEQLARDLSCAVGQDLAREVFLVDRPPSNAPLTWRSTIDMWLSWFSECVAS